MDNFLKLKTKYNKKEIDIINNIDLNVSLSVTNISDTLSHENNENIISNSILFNLPDESIYNIFIDNNEKYSYQLNNILFVNNDKKIYPLNYNLSSINNFSIKNNNIELNILDDNIKQTIYSYNYNGFSYIYSNEENLDKMNIYHKGLYKLNIDHFKNNNNNKVSFDLSDYNYNNDNINNLITNYSLIYSKYNSIIKLFPNTTVFKKIYYSNNLNIISNNDDIYNDYNIIYKDDTCTKNIYNNLEILYKNISPLNSINNYLYKLPILKNNYFIIDIPIIYEYETYVDNKFEFMPEIINFDLDKIKYTFTLDKSNFNIYFSLNKSKSYIYDYKPINIDSNNNYNLYNLYNVKILLRLCLYFDINENIYTYVYNRSNKDLNNLLDLSLSYETLLNYNFKFFIDIHKNLFKKLYHNYNYGFNFDQYGECIGLLLFKYKNDKSELNKNIEHDEYITKSNINSSYIDNNSIYEERLNINKYTNKKDIFINFSENNIDHIFVKNDVDIDTNNYKNIDSFKTIVCSNINFNVQNNKFTRTDFYRLNIDNYLNSFYKYFQNILYCNDLNYLYKSDTYCDLCINGFDLNKYIFKDINNKYSHNQSYICCKNTFKTINSEITIDGKYLELNNIYEDNFNLYILYDDITFTNNNSYGKLQMVTFNDKTIVNNPYIINHDINNKLFKNIYTYRKSGLQYGDYYVPSIQNYLMINKFNIFKYFNTDIYNKYTDNSYDLCSSQFYKTNNNINQYYVNYKEFNNVDIKYENINNVNKKKNTYIWPVFSIPDFSIINSDKYYVVFDEQYNCEFIDYYINKNETEISINIRNYMYDQSNNIIMKFLIDTNKLSIINNISYVDKKHNIFSLKFKINSNRLLDNNTQFIVYYKDNEDYLNNYKINNSYYRILCRICLKIDNN